MSKEEKNRAKDNFWIKQGLFLGIILLWILAIVFKSQMSTLVVFLVFFLLLAISGGKKSKK